MFEDFFQRANILKLPSRERARYNASITYYRDMHNIEAQNLAKGREEGELKKALEIARNLLDILDDATIAQKTGLDEVTVRGLR